MTRVRDDDWEEERGQELLFDAVSVIQWDAFTKELTRVLILCTFILSNNKCEWLSDGGVVAELHTSLTQPSSSLITSPAECTRDFSQIFHRRDKRLRYQL